MSGGPLNIPDRSYRELREIAEKFLAEHHPTGVIPVPVEEIIEFQLGIDIIPMEGLRRSFDIDGYVSKNLREISVDRYIQEERPDDYRYTLAHELAHVLIHGEIVEQFEFGTIKEWKAFILGVNSDERSTYDGQAHQLGSLILVPPTALAREFEAVRSAIARAGGAVAQMLATEKARIIVASNIARKFEVPRSVITDRANRDGSWLEWSRAPASRGGPIGSRSGRLASCGPSRPSQWSGPPRRVAGFGRKRP